MLQVVMGLRRSQNQGPESIGRLRSACRVPVNLVDFLNVDHKPL